MEIKLSLDLSGVNFRPHEFNESLPEHIRGNVKKYKRYKNIKIKEKEYWTVEKSVAIDVQPSDELLNLVTLYTPYLRKIVELKCRKYAEIMVTYHHASEMRGFFIDNNLISICNELGLEIDINVALSG